MAPARERKREREDKGKSKDKESKAVKYISIAVVQRLEVIKHTEKLNGKSAIERG